MSSIYVASSWRNQVQPEVVTALRDAGYDVYDFRNPAPMNDGFAWSEIDENWLGWTPEEFIDALMDEVVIEGFSLDYGALNECDTCVLVLPCGRSAHLEAGYMVGRGKRVIILLSPIDFEPELMYLLARHCATSIGEVIRILKEFNLTCYEVVGSGSGLEKGDIRVPALDLVIEAKKQARTSMADWAKQSEKEGLGYNKTALAWQIAKTPHIRIDISLGYFANLLMRAEEPKIKEPDREMKWLLEKLKVVLNEVIKKI